MQIVPIGSQIEVGLMHSRVQPLRFEKDYHTTSFDSSKTTPSLLVGGNMGGVGPTNIQYGVSVKEVFQSLLL